MTDPVLAGSVRVAEGLGGLLGTWRRAPSQVLARLHVLAVEVVGAPPHVLGWSAGLPDDVFEHDGQLTKRDVRAAALARLAPRPGVTYFELALAGPCAQGLQDTRELGVYVPDGVPDARLELAVLVPS